MHITTEINLKETKKANQTYIIELGRVQIKAKKSHLPSFKVKGSQQLGTYFSQRIGDYAQETLCVLYLNVRNEVVYHQELFVGAVDKACVAPYQMIQTAVLVNSTRIVIAHNHPSGCVSNISDEDINFTEKLEQALNIVGMELVDSIVVSSSDYWSFAENRQ